MMESLSLQAVTLTDGSTAYIQHTLKDAKLVEGQTIQLEDGTTAYIQQVTVQKGNDGDSLPFEDGQAVQLEDGSTAYIHHTPKDEFDPDAVQAVQLEDGTTAYIHHPVSLQGSNTILAVQTEAGLEALHATTDGTVDHETISALEHYANKVSEEDEGVSSTTGLPSDTSKDKPMQLVIDGEVRVSAKGQQIGEKAFRCGFEGCGRLYTTAHHLKVHERAHTGDRPYRCEQPGCGKAFATGYGLKSHTRTHTGEKPYKCPEDTCNKAFKTSGDLQKHIRTHTGERPFKCPFEGCGRSFTTSNIRKVHIRTHTGERPYICCEPGCGRGFASATNYKNHMRIHTGEKPYVCTVPGCGKRFTEYSSLYKHHVVHTHSKPYNCNHCGKTYRQTSTLATHKRTAHGDMEATEESEQALFEQQQQHQQATVIEPALKRPRVTYLSGVEGDGGIPTQVTMVTQDGLGSQVALISQDGTQQVSLSHEDLQALGTAITMVTQDGTTIAVPTHEGDLTGSTGAHTVTMVTADGTEAQQVAIVTSDGMVTGDSALAALHAAEVVQHHQQVALVATANGTQIAVQLEEQQTLEEAIGMATAAIQHEGITQDTVMIDNGQ